MIPVLFALAAQTTSTKLPPAGPIPAPGAEEQLVMQPVNAVFAGIAARDAAAQAVNAPAPQAQPATAKP